MVADLVHIAIPLPIGIGNSINQSRVSTQRADVVLINLEVGDRVSIQMAILFGELGLVVAIIAVEAGIERADANNAIQTIAVQFENFQIAGIRGGDY